MKMLEISRTKKLKIFGGHKSEFVSRENNFPRKG